MNIKTRRSIFLMAIVLIVLTLFTACKSKAERVQEQLDLGQKYLTESNYTEAIIAFTKVIEIDPESIPAYMGRAQAYRGTEQYEEAKTDYTTVIDKTEDQPYTQAEAYVGRAEVDELTEDQQEALGDYQSAATVLDKVDLEKITDVTQQMLEALKAKVYDAIARLSALFGQHEAAVTAYTSALESLDLLPDDAKVMDVPAAKVTSYTGRAQSNLELENYEAVLPDYDALVELGEDKTQERDALLAVLSLSHSQTADLENSDSWLEEVNHSDYAQSIQMDSMVRTLAQAAALAKADGADAYDDIRELLTTEENQAAMRNLLARGYQLRYYDTANSRMLAVYAGDTAWADVHEETNGLVTPEALEIPAATPTQEDLDQVAVSPLYVYYGAYQGRSREGEGLWFIMNPGSRDYEARNYQWENDQPVDGFEQVPVQTRPVTTVAPAIQTVSYQNAETFEDYGFGAQSRNTTITYAIGSTEVRVYELWTSTNPDEAPFSYDVTFVLSQPVQGIEQKQYGATFYVPAGTTIRRADGIGVETFNGDYGASVTVQAGADCTLNYAGMESYGITFAAR